MLSSVIIAGFGGQGILFAGRVLAYAAMLEGKHVTCLPSYGPQMRGGTANCTVVVSLNRIWSPIVRNPSGLIVMNKASLDRFEPAVKPGGVLIMNTSLVDRSSQREDVRAIGVPANYIAEELSNLRVVSIVALGSYVQATGLVSPDSPVEALRHVLAETPGHLLEVNKEAFRRGLAFVRNTSLDESTGARGRMG